MSDNTAPQAALVSTHRLRTHTRAHSENQVIREDHQWLFARGGVVITVATSSPGAFDNNQRINTYHNTRAKHAQPIQPRVAELNAALADTSHGDGAPSRCYPERQVLECTTSPRSVALLGATQLSEKKDRRARVFLKNWNCDSLSPHTSGRTSQGFNFSVQ